MEKYVIEGGNPLKGKVHISGAKNAAVAILPAVLLTNATCVIDNLPNISDVRMMLKIIESLGATVEMLDPNTAKICCEKVNSFVVTENMAGGMRASSYFLGALLGRNKKARVALPGGCDFGVRPLDQHLMGFEALGAKVITEKDFLVCNATALKGNYISLDVISVGATVNIMLAAVRASGTTVIENAAREPHIVDLANFLNTMGANIMGAGTNKITIKGVEELHGASYSIIPDQIEAGTYLAAAAATMGDVTIENVTPVHLRSIIAKLAEIGAEIELFDEAVRLTMDKRPHKCNIKTMPHPGFPTDMQPQIATVLSIADDVSVVTEGVWDDRFRYVKELKKMGADITVEGKRAVIKGVAGLKGSGVYATDLRAGAAMVIAGLIAEGKTEVYDIKYIDRGYDGLVEKFTKLGGKIRRVSE